MGPIEIALVAGTPAATMLAKDLLFKILGPSAEYLGEKLKGNLVGVAGKAQTMMEEADIEPAHVHPRIGVPLLESARLEDDPDMQERWAALLANAANPKSEVDAHPLFVRTLRELSPQDAKVLDRIFDHVAGSRLYASEMGRLTRNDLRDMLVSKDGEVPWDVWRGGDDLDELEKVARQRRQFDVILNVLSSHGLLESRRKSKVGPTGFEMKHEDEFNLTTLGQEFVTACRRPKRKEGERG